MRSLGCALLAFAACAAAADASYGELLAGLGLQTHQAGLEAEDVTDAERLASLTDPDLQALGLKLGARRRVQAWALAAHPELVAAQQQRGAGEEGDCKPQPGPMPAPETDPDGVGFEPYLGTSKTDQPRASEQLATPATVGGKYEYCVVGAGPAGLQLGKLMQDAGTDRGDYVIFERGHHAGVYFSSYPRHRKLISLNKRFTGRSDPEFNLRHDWNSLLGFEATPVTKRTERRWPPADTVVEYMRDAAEELGPNVALGADVGRIERSVPGDAASGFRLAVGFAAGGSKQVQCGKVIIATGIHVPNVPPLPGIELTMGYEELPEDGRPFQEKNVAVLGLGNSAFETADALAPFVNFVHTFPGHANKGPSQTLPVAWESRYVGNVRALNAALLDAYLLKSLDGGFEDNAVTTEK
eukprot:SAG22_NODE_3368_length_1755_cov_1.553140_1_plen_411_part_10